MPQRPSSAWCRSRRVLLGAAAVLVLSAAGATASPRAIPSSGALKVAQAIVLRPSDLPAMSGRTVSVAEEHPASEQFTACMGGSPSGAPFAAALSWFTTSKLSRVTTEVLSGVVIQPAAETVARDFAAFARPRALSCLVAADLAWERPALPKGETVTGSAVRLLPVVSGTEQSSAARVTMIFHYRTTTATSAMFFDYIAFAYGQAEVQLAIVSQTPPSTALESKLAALLLARAHTTIG